MFVSASGQSERYLTNTGSVVKVAGASIHCTREDFGWMNRGLQAGMREITSGSYKR